MNRRAAAEIRAGIEIARDVHRKGWAYTPPRSHPLSLKSLAFHRTLSALLIAEARRGQHRDQATRSDCASTAANGHLQCEGQSGHDGRHFAGGAVTDYAWCDIEADRPEGSAP
jgi:hypothetical protein